MTDITIEQFEAGLNEVASSAGAFLVRSLPGGGTKHQLADVPMLPKEFLAVVSLVKPKLVYFGVGEFDVLDCVRERFDIPLDGSESAEITTHPALKSLQKRWTKHNGQRDMVVASFACDGVLHTCVMRPAWVDEFDAAVVEAFIAMTPALKAEENATSREIDPVIKQHAIRLADHAAFSAPRASKEKRTYLAETLFPDASSREIWRIVDLATNIAWLRGATGESEG